MSVENDADLATMLADFGETFLAPGGGEFEAIFDGASELAQDVRGERPSIQARYSDVRDIPIDDADVSIWRKATGDRYVIRDAVHDGIGGMSVLVLELDQ